MFYEILTIGPITIHGYGLMIAIGLLAAILLASYRAKRRGMDDDLVFNIIIIAIVFGFLGAKIMYLIVEFKDFIKDPLGLLFSGSGFVLYGGIILGALAPLLYCRKKKISFLEHFDLFMPSVAVAQGFGRVGCLGAGCCYGHETESIFSIVFKNSPLAPNNVHLIPTQIYSSLGNFAIAAILILYARKNRKAGNVGLLYLALYSVFRFGIEFFRHDHRGTIWIFSTSQFISIFIFAIALTAFLINRKRGLKDTNKKEEETKEEEKQA